MVLLVVLLVAAFFIFDLDRHLTMEGLKSGLNEFVEIRDRSPLMVAGIYFIIYILVTALSLPGAAVMTLAGGALFGLLWGTVIVSFASSIGALLAFLVARYVLRDFVQSRFGDRLKTVNAGIARDGAFYLFTLRLIPVFPFFLINLVMGLTGMRALTFYAVSQIGMLAGTVVYVNAGTQLARIDSLSGILSPTLLFSFALLGIFPWLARGIVGFWQRRRVYARWPRPTQYDRNLIVIGAGAAGLVSAYIAAAVKAKVTLIENHKMGGDCLNYGCVPSKALIKSAKLANQIRHADRYGLEAGQPRFSFRQVMARVHEVISKVEPHDSVERYTSLGVDVLEGHARIIDPWTVETTFSDGSSKRLTTRSIVIAAGAEPFVPPLPGLDETGYLTSDTLWEAFAALDTPPERLVVLGGGPIGTELTQALARLGSNVTQIEMAPRVLVREDEEVSTLVKQSLQTDGVTVLTGHKAVRCLREGEENYIEVEHAGE
ncbi:MAG: FAD-dependent oxidoreductase, partial [Gammaproteobacteria bacterium]